MTIKCLNCDGSHPTPWAVDECWRGRDDFFEYDAAVTASVAKGDGDTYSGQPSHLADRAGSLERLRQALADAEDETREWGRGYGMVKFDMEEEIERDHLRQAVLIAEAERA